MLSLNPMTIVIIVTVIAIALAVLIDYLARKRNSEPVTIWKETIHVNEGERRVARLLSNLPKEQYKVVNDLMVLYNGHTVQIDHVVVSQYGIFVIETKNYHGSIYGGYDSEYWTQGLGGRSYRFYNPIFQNKGHVDALRNMLGLEEYLFVSIIAFSENVEFKFQMTDRVIYMHQVNAMIQSFREPLLSEEKVERIYQWLLALNIDSADARRQHVVNVRETINRKQNVIANNICPRCGGKLILRNGRYGRFYGCQNYPNCRFIHKT